MFGGECWVLWKYICSWFVENLNVWWSMLVFDEEYWWNVLVFYGECWRVLVFGGECWVCWRILHFCLRMSGGIENGGVCWWLFMCFGVCWSMWFLGGECWCLLKNVAFCGRISSGIYEFDGEQWCLMVSPCVLMFGKYWYLVENVGVWKCILVFGKNVGIWKVLVFNGGWWCLGKCWCLVKYVGVWCSAGWFFTINSVNSNSCFNMMFKMY